MKLELELFFNSIRTWTDNKLVDSVIRFNMLRMRLGMEGMLPADFLKKTASISDVAIVESFRKQISEEDVKVGSDLLYYFSVSFVEAEYAAVAKEAVVFLNEKLDKVDINYEGSFQRLEESFDMSTDELLEELEFLPQY